MPFDGCKKKQVYTGIYEFHEGKLSVIEPQMAVGIEEIARKLCALERKVIFLGDGVPGIP